ncbi:hypothetical protein VSR01_21960 [Actinacidiphila sp. DG2A-62]|uniref:hypothetical protein n=1 Tax=Actinacidiphila sp. DG2A-62 TaxID=3108821 RepID=UPI002DBEA565|nr:hypothetical protein [Actinacidiphila sp. DG2A-62]MEC3996038.1 hypothetical protein [Actinacidiphila sp. DG2A-62]
MFLSPKHAPPPAVPVHPTQHAPACHCQAPAPVRRTAPTVGVIAGGAAVVITVGVVLTALLVAVTAAAVSVAVVAVVLRALLAPPRQR